jgi:hypothetical protein
MNSKNNNADKINSEKSKKEKRAYKKPEIVEKDMRAYFMVCSTNPGKCAPCTQIRQSGGKCF